MKVGVISLGCAKNQVDTERMLGLLAAAGFTFTGTPEEADILIVNTCGFINPAKEESIQTILEMAACKKTGACRLLVATGCLTQRYRSELEKELPEVDILLGVNEYEKLPSMICRRLGLPDQPCAAQARILTTPPHRAYLRIGDGCSNRCTYCAIPLIRGPLIDEPIEGLIDEAKRLSDTGVTELTVIAQDTSGYGKARYGQPRLIELLKRLDCIRELHWIRLLYTYPDTVTPELIDTLTEGARLVPYLDMPLQHCSDEILRRMHRRGSKLHITGILDYLYTHAPDMTLRTTMMVGFPGETSAQFDELMRFLRDYPFDRVGAFAFSPEEGTPAAEMPGQIPEQIKSARLDALMRQQQSISLERNRRMIGHTTELLVESADSGDIRGRTPREAPDADGTVRINGGAHLRIGDYVPIRLTDADSYDMTGERI